MIKEVKIKRNIIMVNKHHNRRYWNKEGIIVIERDDGKRFILNLRSGTERLRRLAGN